MERYAGRPVEPFWLEGARGRLYSMFFPPDAEPRYAVLYVPPFAEDLNRCRAMSGLMARTFAAHGVATMVCDLYGTGDSEGLFEDTTWEGWLDDIRRAADWLAERTGVSVVLWGMRSGALMAAQLAAAEPPRFQRLLFWQPVVDGKPMLTQFLRLRVANLNDWGLPGETTKDMRAQMVEGKHIEVAGYLLPPEVGLPLDALKLATIDGLTGLRIDWLEMIPEPDQPFSMAAQRAMDAVAKGNELNVVAYQSPPFWELWRQAWAPELIDKTLALFES